jgi:acyl carrier protein
MKTKFIHFFKDILDIDDREILFTDRFRDLEEWDSIANLSLIAAIDDEFDVIIENKEFKNLHTVIDLWDKIQDLKS